MNQLLTLLRRDNGSQAMRQSAALTTVYLLELNHKFETFMRDKVDRLESRVSAQQARQAGRAATEAAWEDGLAVEVETWPTEVQLDEAVPPKPAALFVEADETEEPDRDPTRLATRSGPSAAPVETDLPDYAALLIGDLAEVTSAVPSLEMAAAEPAEADEALPEAEAVEDIAENDDVWADPVSTQPPALWAGDDPERSGPGSERVDDDTAHRIEETALELGIERIEAAEKPATPSTPSDDDIVADAAKLVLLTGDPRPDVVGIPASELLSDEPEALIGWSPEADLGEATPDQEAQLVDPTKEATPDDEAGAAVSDETAEWAAALPVASRKGDGS